MADASDGTTVSQRENGANVPDGVRRERVVELLDGRRWPALLVGEGVPLPWDRGVRWYRRASRERSPRETLGSVVAANLEDPRGADSPAALRQRYCEKDGEWARGVAARQGLREEHEADPRRMEDAGFGLRWLELAHGLRFDRRRSLVPQLPLSLLGAEPSDSPGTGARRAAVVDRRKQQ